MSGNSVTTKNDEEGLEEQPKIKWGLIAFLIIGVLLLGLLSALVLRPPAPSTSAAPTTQVAQTAAPVQAAPDPRIVSDENTFGCPVRVKLQHQESIVVGIPAQTTMDFSPSASDGTIRVCSVNDSGTCVGEETPNLEGSINYVQVTNLRDHEIEFSCSYRSATPTTSANNEADRGSRDNVVYVDR